MAALVIEAQYGDFFVVEKIVQQPAARMQRLLAELSILHANLQIVYAGNRALANLWTQSWFEARAAQFHQPQLPGVQEASAQYKVMPDSLDTRIRLAVLETLPNVFTTRDLQSFFTQTKPERIKRILNALRDEGRIRMEGRGRGALWKRSVQS